MNARRMSLAFVGHEFALQAGCPGLALWLAWLRGFVMQRRWMRVRIRFAYGRGQVQREK